MVIRPLTFIFLSVQDGFSIYTLFYYHVKGSHWPLSQLWESSSQKDAGRAPNQAATSFSTEGFPVMPRTPLTIQDSTPHFWLTYMLRYRWEQVRQEPSKLKEVDRHFMQVPDNLLADGVKSSEAAGTVSQGPMGRRCSFEWNQRLPSDDSVPLGSLSIESPLLAYVQGKNIKTDCSKFPLA